MPASESTILSASPQLDPFELKVTTPAFIRLPPKVTSPVPVLVQVPSDPIVVAPPVVKSNVAPCENVPELISNVLVVTSAVVNVTILPTVLFIFNLEAKVPAVLLIVVLVPPSRDNVKLEPPKVCVEEKEALP